MVKYLCLSFQYTITISQIFQMTGTNVGDHTGIWLCNRRQTMHLTKIADSHLQNRNFIFLAKSEHRQWKSQFVIKITQSFQYLKFLFQYCCNHLFRAGLSHTSGDTYNRNLQLFQIICCQILYCLQRRLNLNIREIHFS